MKYELEIISDILSNTKKPKIIIKGDKIRKLFDLDTIEVEEYIDSRTGKHISKYCSIFINGNYYKINKPYEDLKAIVINRSIPVLGFAYKSKRYK